MIFYKNADLTKATQKVIVHGCNAQGVMGSGVAKAIRAKWSGAYEIYKVGESLHGLSVGAVIYYWDPKDELYIANAITQEFYGRDGKRYVSYDAIADCFKSINNFCFDNDIKEIACSKIGSSLGGGDWNVIKAIIDTTMTVADVVVYEI